MFQGLTQAQFQELLGLAKPRDLHPGDVVVEEGDEADALFILLRGQLEVLKRDQVTGSNHRLATLEPVACVGEVALLDQKPRSATVRAITEANLLAVRFDDLHAHGAACDSLEASIKVNLGRELANRMRRLSDTTVKSLREQLAEAKARATAGIFITSLFVGICTYVYVLEIVSAVTRGLVSSSVITIPFIALFCVLFARAVRRSGNRISDYGVTWEGCRHSLTEGLLFSVPLALLAVAVKAAILAFHPAAAGAPLFALAHNLRHGDQAMLVELAAYATLSPLQEFIARGSVQGAFQDFLVDKRRTLKAILISNLLFSMMHLHLSIVFSVLVFFPGLFWGWLYSRHRTLVGVCASHVLLGVFAFWVVGFDVVIK
jgi:CRP-like cAMP-binding protein